MQTDAHANNWSMITQFSIIQNFIQGKDFAHNNQFISISSYKFFISFGTWDCIRLAMILITKFLILLGIHNLIMNRSCSTIFIINPTIVNQPLKMTNLLIFNKLLDLRALTTFQTSHIWNL